MTKIPLRIESWEYDDVANTLVGVFIDMPRADDPDPVNYRITTRIEASISLAVPIKAIPPKIPHRRP